MRGSQPVGTFGILTQDDGGNYKMAAAGNRANTPTKRERDQVQGRRGVILKCPGEKECIREKTDIALATAIKASCFNQKSQSDSSD